MAVAVSLAWDNSKSEAVDTRGRDEWESEAALIRRFDSRIRRMAKGFILHPEDVEQIGRIALLEAARLWLDKEEHTCQFWTYARKRVRGAMMDYVRRELSRRQYELSPMASSNIGKPQEEAEWVRGHAGDHNIIRDPKIGGAERALESKELLAALSAEESKIVFSHLVEGKDIRTISKEMNMPKSSVHRALTTALETMRRRDD